MAMSDMSEEQLPVKKIIPSRFQKGKPPGPGRPKGSVPKAVLEVRKFCQGLMGGLFKDPKYKRALRDRILRGKEHPAIVQAILAYAYGKPADKIILEDPDGALGGGQGRRDELIRQLCNRFAEIATKGHPEGDARQALDGGAGGTILELEGHCEAESDPTGRRVDAVADPGRTRVGEDQNGS